MGTNALSDLTLEGLVHDLNNVFETISEAAEMLEGDGRWATLAARIRRSVNRGRRIVGSLSASARAEQDFDAILDNSIEFASDLFRAVDASPVDFVRSVEPGLRVQGSPAAWERVLLNLFVNAAQAMKDGGTVEISAKRVPGGIEIAVADSGPGIPPEILPQIFDPHFSTKSSSAGLGLHIVKSLVAEHGGLVTANNRPGTSGAAFSIRLPAAG